MVKWQNFGFQLYIQKGLKYCRPMGYLEQLLVELFYYFFSIFMSQKIAFFGDVNLLKIKKKKKRSQPVKCC